MSERRSLRGANLAIVLGVLGTIACAETMTAGVEDRIPPEAGTPPSFTPPPNEGGADVSAPDKPKLCIATECPSPYATCGFSADRCRNNLSNDPDNCGACGNKCASEIYVPYGGVNVDFRHLVPRCVDGQCTVACSTTDFQDCNGRLDDGCETEVKGNPDHCGACGNKCPDGQPCSVTLTGQSKCGCPAGTSYCPSTKRCVDLQNDDYNCGACGSFCINPVPEAGVPPRPPHTKYGCAMGTCAADADHIKCESSSESWSDCNGDLHAANSDGCEVKLGFSRVDTNGVPMYIGDENNCGFCGKTCASGQTCALLREGGMKCACAPGETLCASRRATWCADVLSDPLDCGACGNVCPVDPAKNLLGVCDKGVCIDQCTPGWGDCDGNPDNGCETNLKTNIAHCGACGQRCNTTAGQPCIDGVCLMTECDAGTVTQ